MVSSDLSVVSAEFQTQPSASFRVRFKSMALCHQTCCVRFRVDIGKDRSLLLLDILHEHVLQHYTLHPPQPSFRCPRFRRLTVDMVHESHLLSQFVQEMFGHHPFVTTRCQGIQFCFGGTQAHSRDRADNLAFHHCTTPPLVLLQVMGLPCPVAVCVHVHGLRECDDFDQAHCTRCTFQVSCDALHG